MNDEESVSYDTEGTSHIPAGNPLFGKNAPNEVLRYEEKESRVKVCYVLWFSRGRMFCSFPVLVISAEHR